MRDSSLEVVFGRDPEQVWTVREFVTSYYADLLDDPDLLYALSLAVQELLENATKYSSGGPSLLTVRLGAPDRRERIFISVTNEADPTQRQRLKEALDAVCGPERPRDVWEGVVRQAQRRQDGSGLGLARLRMEADLALQLDLMDNRVRVSAIASLPQSAPAR